MRLLIDSCVSWLLAEELRRAGHDVATVAERGVDPGDIEILKIAAAEMRVLITLDKGFGGLVVVDEMAHAGMLRLRKISAEEHASVCLRTLQSWGDELAAGAIVIVTPERVRVRRRRL